MSFNTLYESINRTILAGLLTEGEALIADLKPVALAERRATEHLRGIVAFRQGNISGAQKIWQEALANYGENLNLLRDLASAHYQLQEMTDFRAKLRLLQDRLREWAPQLGQQTRFECELMLGKFFEEEAQLGLALESYERVLRLDLSVPQRLRAMIQKARWLALYRPDSDLSAHYRELISAPLDSISHDLRIELEHSLMLVELRLVGVDHAYQRIVKVEDQLDSSDCRLFYFDFVEGSLAQELPLSSAVLTKINDFKDLDPYEGFLKLLVQGELESQRKIEELGKLSARLPWALYLRLLCLASNHESQSSVRQELQRKMQLILRDLDPKTQELWSQRLKQTVQLHEIGIDFSARRRSVSVQGRWVDLSKKKMGLQLFEGLAERPELSIDQAIELLWQSNFSPEHYHRLRMGVHRLNALINKVTGLGKIIEVDSQFVRLRPEVKMRRSDDVASSALL